jgi:RNA polymerase sigma-70 factor, ECF subfamily
VDFEALATAHKDAVYRQLIRACGNEEDAEDVLVEALLKAYRGLDQLRDRDAFRAWLAQIGRRVCWQLKARQSLEPLLQLSALEETGAAVADPAPGPDQLFAVERLQDLLHRAVDSLAPAYRDVYVMRDLEERTGEEVAQQLGLSLAAQKSRLHRARAQVRHYLDAALAGRPVPGKLTDAAN